VAVQVLGAAVVLASGERKFDARLGNRREAFGRVSTCEAFSEVGLLFDGARKPAGKAVDRTARHMGSVL
jgi:hypothetical protein